MNGIEEGQSMPAFDLPTNGGGSVSSAGLKGQGYVLYLYPKDDTSGCTKESIAFTEAANKFSDAGFQIIGLSKDNVKSHDKFVAKHNLGITLASDEEGVLVEALGSWVEKSMYGKKYMGIDRSTFLVDGDGKAVKIWRKVKVPGHVDEVLEAAKGLV